MNASRPGPLPPIDPDLAAMARLQAGDDRALDELMARWSQRLASYLFRVLNSEADAVDLAQETFVRVYENRHRYRPEGRFSTWLFTIAANLARNRLRWRARHPEVSLNEEDGSNPKTLPPSPVADAAAALDQQEKCEAVRAALAALPDDLRQPLVLFEYEERSYAEIAAITGSSPKAVEMRIYRARQRLRQSLAPWLPD